MSTSSLPPVRHYPGIVHDAGALAHAATVSASPSGLSSQCLTFLLGGEVFAIDILCIKEIIEFRRLTVVPMMPDAIRGVINLRGAVVPVIDLHARFGHAPAEIGKRTCIVIVEVLDGLDARVVGLLVDAVNEVIDVDMTDLAPPPAFGARIQSDFIRGIAKAEARFVIVLDVGKVFSLESLHALPGDMAEHVS
jgi:purine-binding chemotaxis protein CheW